MTALVRAAGSVPVAKVHPKIFSPPPSLQTTVTVSYAEPLDTVDTLRALISLNDPTEADIGAFAAAFHPEVKEPFWRGVTTNPWQATFALNKMHELMKNGGGLRHGRFYCHDADVSWTLKPNPLGIQEIVFRVDQDGNSKIVSMKVPDGL